MITTSPYLSFGLKDVLSKRTAFQTAQRAYEEAQNIFADTIAAECNTNDGKATHYYALQDEETGRFYSVRVSANGKNTSVSVGVAHVIAITGMTDAP